MGPRARARLRWTGSAAEALIFLSSVAFLVTTARWALIVWVVVGSLYIAGGCAAIWRGRPVEAGAVTELRALARWLWIAPLLAGTTGAVSAVTALLAKDQVVDGHRDLGLTVAASLGVILSWALMQVGFAQIYLVIDVTGGHGDLRFPGGTTPSFLSFAYFSFTLGTSAQGRGGSCSFTRSSPTSTTHWSSPSRSRCFRGSSAGEARLSSYA
ncbi:DUF1345 domain-containing protein [Embleya sp. NPDC059237]|uniref:DUF1345 domain-containing protein n=1 Tax=Embleya sp. NPDC059237 TaxID=3346784 RepID=UPI00369C1DE9